MANKQSNPKPRSYLNRKINQRATIPKFLIVCEGEKTEPNYFKKFPVSTRPDIMDLDIEGVGKTSLSLVQETERLKKEKEKGYYDQVWCVFDRDFKNENFNAQNFNSAIALAKQKKFQIAYSNDAFELWYILHFEYYVSATHRDDYKKLLEDKKRLGHKYKKNSETMYKELEDKQHTAIQNAKKLLEKYDPAMTGNHNPSTTVHLLVEELNKAIQNNNPSKDIQFPTSDLRIWMLYLVIISNANISNAKMYLLLCLIEG